MTILDYYIERQKNKDWVEKFQSTSSKKKGKFFSFKNTNFRKITTFIHAFNQFRSNHEIDRNEWGKHSSHGQEVDKQYVVNMRRSKLFSKKNDLYIFTKKGISFNRFLDLETTEEERWIISFLYLLNSYFELIPNYIIKKVDDFFYKINGFNIESYVFLDDIQKLISSKKNKQNLFSSDVFWILTFFEDVDFLTLFINSSENDRSDFKKYVISMLENNNENDIIVKKYKPGGQYTVNMFVDDLKIIFYGYYIRQNMNYPFEIFYREIIEIFSSNHTINTRKTLNFIFQEKDVFYQILDDLNIENTDLIYDYSSRSKVDENIVNELQENLDVTSFADVRKQRAASGLLKKVALQKNDYKCVLEPLFGCNYFTSRESGENYLEIHHFIPREFSNEFENSIEVVSNYIPLCPHCHKLIHHASDRERAAAIRYLFNLRNNELFDLGLEIDFETIKDFYKLNNSKTSHL